MKILLVAINAKYIHSNLAEGIGLVKPPLVCGVDIWVLRDENP